MTTSPITDLLPHRAVLTGGTWHESASTFVVEDPGTGDVLSEVSDANSEDATRAVEAAHAAGPGWRGTPPRVRADVLRRASDLMLHDVERLAGLIMSENGKPRADATAEVAYAADFLRWYSEEAVRAGGSFGPSPAGGTRAIVTHHPVGVAGLVTPWNFPAAMITRKVAPALAAGCTVVIKPAAETPLTAIALCRLLEDAGVPDGVVNLVPTTNAPEVVSTWLADGRVRKISFTGSTAVGRILLGQAADRVVTTSMELGGNAPFIVCQDAHIESAVAGALVAKFRNGGQACTAANRFLVNADVAKEFTATLGRAVQSMRVGPANAPGGVDVGPLITAEQAERVRSLIDRAVDHGARVAHQATIDPALKGHFVAPVVLDQVDPDSELVTEEIFGPVAPIVTWSDEEEVISMANGSEYGLASYVFAGDTGRALRMGERLEAGMVGVNRGTVSDPSAPFGGVKQSGVGREGARDGLLEFTETQFLSIDWPQS